jgi:hypothetical protein
MERGLSFAISEFVECYDMCSTTTGPQMTLAIHEMGSLTLGKH